MDQILPQLLVGIFISAAASLLGVFAILKRMSLVGDALSHVALPGIALALFFRIDPFLGALVFLFFSAFGIWILEYRTNLSVDTIVGVFFTASLAAGALFIPELDILEALFGDIQKLTSTDIFISIFLSLALISILLLMHKKLALHMVSQDLAASIGIGTKQLEFIFLMLFSLGVALGIKFIGALLMGALIIIPAAAAINISRSLHGFMALSVAFGILSAIFGVYLASIYNLPPGPIFILSGTAIFVLSFIARGIFKK